MTTPSIDPRLVHVLSGEVASLQQHLARVGHDLGLLRQQLDGSPMQAPLQGPPQQHPVSRPQVQSPPVSTHPVRPIPRPMPTPPRDTTPWWQRDGVVSRVLAAAGAAVTAIGVVMLVVLAAQSGWFGPGPRVAAGALLSGALVAAAHRVVARPGGRVGAVALAATGFAGLYLDLAAVTALYGWVHPVVGLVVGLGVAALGVAVALRWSSQSLAVMVVAGIATLAPVATGGITPALLAFLVVVQIAASPVEVREQWVWLRVVRTVPVVGAVLLAGLLAHVETVPTADLLPLLVVAGLSFGTAVVAWWTTLAHRAVDPASLASIAATAAAVLVTATLFSRPVAGGVDAAVALALVAILVARRELVTTVRLVLTATASVAVASALVTGTADQVRILALLLVATTALLVGARTRSGVSAAAGAFFALLGTSAHSQITSVDSLSSPVRALDSGWASVPASVAMIAMAVAGVLAALRTIEDATLRTLAAGLAGVAGLFGATAVCVITGIEIGGRTGFVVGHGAATIVWMTVAVALLMRGLSDATGARAVLTAGLTVAASAIAKLFLFDLSALGGLPRAAAFLVAGVMLLGIGTRYARSFADRAVTADAGGPATRSH
ncbi:DUF2339 domain-containing protein [Rhodococcus sp. BP-241]|uniref:DUF2339 domain-containing protein n=1 Tax=Rhodococcus sp. BP-241 TaxID=2739441 RepID=UPI001C9A4039|nr:DUF2339 domain-containing protein [Rhodococcus sp. BP-241]MBY6707234.1 DUF2339 domain-containing protein [Rhodococcus sp. BP-241]